MAGTGFAEGIFNRFVLANGMDYSVIFSRRIYDADGDEIDRQLGQWEKQHGADTEKALMSLAPIPMADLLELWKNLG